MENKDQLLSNYNYDIPQELIAQTPAEKRSDSFWTEKIKPLNIKIFII